MRVRFSPGNADSLSDHGTAWIVSTGTTLAIEAGGVGGPNLNPSVDEKPSVRYFRGMTEVSAKAFLSYARADNEREGGRIVRLAQKIREEYETLTGTTIEIFVDSAEIRWGEDFRSRLDEALQQTAFFIPVLTPTYFLREECRKEMKAFVTSASALGLDALLLSVRYVPVPDMVEDSADELKATAARMQFESWDHLRLADENSAEYRAAVNRLAARLVELVARLEVTPSVAPAEALVEAFPAAEGAENRDDAPGTIDLLAELEPALEEWGSTLTEFPPTIGEINQLFVNATAEMEAANGSPKSFAAKVRISHELALAAEEPLTRLEALSKRYVTQLSDLDPRMRAFLSVAAQADPEERAAALASMRQLVDASAEASVGFTTAADAARANSGVSRDLRPVLRRFETATRNVIDAQSLIASWGEVIDKLLSDGAH
ncbi:hypothetical protein DOE76_00620 [Leifsonia sp. ku-ls]|nr:hypothetical protein DOE76_00620 [Leifsonia sp. ku-ls]